MRVRQGRERPEEGWTMKVSQRQQRKELNTNITSTSFETYFASIYALCHISASRMKQFPKPLRENQNAPVKKYDFFVLLWPDWLIFYRFNTSLWGWHLNVRSILSQLFIVWKKIPDLKLWKRICKEGRGRACFLWMSAMIFPSCPRRYKMKGGRHF